MSKKTTVKRVYRQSAKSKAAKTTESKEEVVFTAKDKALLMKAESVIASNIGAFLRLGEALCLIRDRNLQKITDPRLTFDEYCSKKWGFGKAYAYRLIGGYECVQNLKAQLASKRVNVFPTNEAQVRPLTSLSPDFQVRAWMKVLKKAKPGGITAAMVEDAVKGPAAKPARAFRVSIDPAAAKAVHKKLATIAKLVGHGLMVRPEDRSVSKLSLVLEKIQNLLTGIGL